MVSLTTSQFLPRYSFSLILAIGVGFGLLWSFELSSASKTNFKKLDTAVLSLIGAFVGGRVSYILIHWQYYQAHYLEIIEFWLGGISWMGAIPGALLVLWIVSRFQYSSFFIITDSLLPLFTCMTISIWLANWIFGYAYGEELDAWWAPTTIDAWGTVTKRWPIALIGIVSTLVFHFLSEYLQTKGKTPKPGIATFLELSGFSLTILVLSSIREDPMMRIAGLRLDAWFSIGLLIFLTFLATLWTRSRLNRKTSSAAAQK